MASRVLCLLSLLCCFFYTAGIVALPICRVSQLDTKPFVIDHPGMMKQVTVYALINYSSQACRLQSDRVRLAVRKKGRSQLLPLWHEGEKSSWLVLPSDRSFRPMSLRQVTWFAVLTTAAGDGRGTMLPFWGVGSPSTERVLPHASGLSVYRTFRRSSALHQGLRDWFMDRQCSRSDVSRTITLSSNDVVDFDAPLSCG